MKKDFMAENARKKKATNEVMLVLFILILIFVVIIARLALRRGAGGRFFDAMPSRNDAYEIAKDYITPTLRFPDAKFADEEYQYSRSKDSVYTFKSYFLTSYLNNGKHKTSFTITLKYNGGDSASDRNWTLLKLQEY